jgi:hypothetical protein
MPAGEEVEGAGSDPARQTYEGTAMIQAPAHHPGGARHAMGDASTPAGAAARDEFVRSLVEVGLVDLTEVVSFKSAGWPSRLKVGMAAVNSGSATFTVRFEELSFKTGNAGRARR